MKHQINYCKLVHDIKSVKYRYGAYVLLTY